MPKRVLQGVVISDCNESTITVRVERMFMHPLYKKTVKKSSKYMVHDQGNKYSVGDKVTIQENPPISKMKSWIVLN